MPDRNDIIQALKAEKAGLEARGDTDRAAEVDAQLAALDETTAPDAAAAAEQRADSADSDEPLAAEDTQRDASDKTPRAKR